jgi:hypothetical protein
MNYLVEHRPPHTYVVHVSGPVTPTDTQALQSDLLARPTFPGSVILVDARDVTNAPSTPEVRQIARDMRSFVAVGVRAMAIVTPTGVLYGIARMFSAFTSIIGLNVEAFTEVPDAECWLEEQAAGIS